MTAEAEGNKKRAIMVKILDNYIGIMRLVNVQVAILPTALGPLISKLLIGHKCKIRVQTSARSACRSTRVSCAVSSLTGMNYTSTE